MRRIVLSLLFFVLINLSYVDLHAYSHLLGDADNPIQECDHDSAFRNAETISNFLLPAKINLTSSCFTHLKSDTIIELVSYSKVRFLSSFYTNLPPPYNSLV